MFSQSIILYLFPFLFSICSANHYYQEQFPLQLQELGENSTSAIMAHHGGQECDGYRTVAYFVNWVRLPLGSFYCDTVQSPKLKGSSVGLGNLCTES
jgi:hypothetical protein